MYGCAGASHTVSSCRVLLWPAAQQDRCTLSTGGCMGHTQSSSGAGGSGLGAQGSGCKVQGSTSNLSPLVEFGSKCQVGTCLAIVTSGYKPSPDMLDAEHQHTCPPVSAAGLVTSLPLLPGVSSKSASAAPRTCTVSSFVFECMRVSVLVTVITCS